MICSVLFWYIFKNASDLKEYKAYKKSLKSIKYEINKAGLIKKLVESKFKKKTFNIDNISGELYLKKDNVFIFINSNSFSNYLELNNYLNNFISNNEYIFINVYIVIYSSNYDNNLDDISRLNNPYNMLANNIYIKSLDFILNLEYIDDNCEYKVIENYKKLLNNMFSKKGE